MQSDNLSHDIFHIPRISPYIPLITVSSCDCPSIILQRKSHTRTWVPHFTFPGFLARSPCHIPHSSFPGFFHPTTTPRPPSTKHTPQKRRHIPLGQYSFIIPAIMIYKPAPCTSFLIPKIYSMAQASRCTITAHGPQPAMLRMAAENTSFISHAKSPILHNSNPRHVCRFTSPESHLRYTQNKPMSRASCVNTQIAFAYPHNTYLHAQHTI